MEIGESRGKLKIILIVAAVAVTAVVLVFLFVGGKPLDDFKKLVHINTTSEEPDNGTNNSSSSGGAGGGAGGGSGGGGGGAGSMTDEQLQNAINQLFSEQNGTNNSSSSGNETLPPEDPVVIFPPTEIVVIPPNTTDDVGIGIKNNDTTPGATSQFSYIINNVGNSDCGISEQEALSWIIAGGSESNITLESGQIMTARITFSIPAGTPSCNVRFTVEVQKDGAFYATDFFNIEIP